MTKEEIVAKVQNAGVVGAGGAGFPTHVKINAKVDTVIANGAECEPLLRIDQQISAIRAKELVEGMKLIMQATGAKKGVFGFKSKYHDAINAVGALLKNEKDMEIGELENFYPAGDEQILIYELTGRLVPEGGIPLQAGIVVNNVSTMINVYNAVANSSPVVMRGLTVTGEVANPMSLEVPVGTPIKKVISLAGGPAISDFVVINGGPMMGKEADYESDVVTKTTSGLLVLSQNHYLVRLLRSSLEKMVVQSKAACCQCTECTVLCSRYVLGHNLEPHKVMRTLLAGRALNAEEVTMAYLCSECNLCAYYACPMQLSPMKINRQYKQMLGKQNIKNPHHRADLKVHPAREGRKVPVSRLIGRLNLYKYDVKSLFIDKKWNIDFVKIPLQQHIGVPSEAVVKKGDAVKTGALIARMPDGKLGANIHASIDGTVADITEKYIEIRAK